jgi:hypothetical protein
MNADAESIAAHMRVQQLAVNEYLAESIEVQHVPPSPIDGQIEGASFAQMTQAFATSGDVEQEVLSVSVEGDEVVQRAILRNHADGSTTAHTGRFRVVGGVIVAVHSTYEPLETAKPSQGGSS